MSSCYRAYGLTIASDIALLGPRASGGTKIDVDIREGFVPERLEAIETETLHWAANADELLLDVPRVGRFHVRHGRTVRYSPRIGAPAQMVQAFLLGSCLGAVLHQRGQQVLHGSVVARGDTAFAICGKSGAGKSTSAAWLLERGARMISDDLAVLATVDPPLVLPGYPQAKLTGAALARLGRGTSDLQKLPDDRDKYAVPRGASFLDRELPLGAIFVIERHDRSELSAFRLDHAQAIAALVKHTYRRHYVVGSRAADHYRAWAKVADQVPVWFVGRPRGADTIEVVVAAMAREIEALASLRTEADRDGE